MPLQKWTNDSKNTITWWKNDSLPVYGETECSLQWEYALYQDRIYVCVRACVRVYVCLCAHTRIIGQMCLSYADTVEACNVIKELFFFRTKVWRRYVHRKDVLCWIASVLLNACYVLYQCSGRLNNKMHIL